MKKRLIRAVILLFCSPLLVQCVLTKDITNLDLRIRNLDNRMVKVDQQLKQMGGASAGSNLEQIQSKQAEMANTLDRLNMEMLQIKGQLEEGIHQYRAIQNENSEFKSELNRKIEDLSDQIVLLADQMNQTSESIKAAKKGSEEAISQARAAAEMARAAEVAAEEAAKVKIRAAAPITVSSGTREILPQQTKISPADKKRYVAKSVNVSDGPGKEIYDRALALFRSSKFNEAYRTFTEYIDQHPKGKMAPNARFWLGDCYYNQQDYELAILEYQKVIADYPGHAKSPAALLKQGLAFEKLKDNETAKIVYGKLIEEYPKSEQMATARTRIDSLK